MSTGTLEKTEAQKEMSLPKVTQLLGGKAEVQFGASLTPKFSSIAFDTCGSYDTFTAHVPMCTGPRCAGLDYETCAELQETEGSI